MNTLVPFDFDGAAVRTMTRDGAPWFALGDVCRVLDIRNSRMAAARLDNDERGDVSITDAIGRDQLTTVVSESGLYALVLKSRKPSARRFAKWVTSEVVPAIRRTGAYVIARPEDTEGDIQTRVNAAVREAVERRDAEIIRLQGRVIAQLDEAVALRLDVAELEADAERLAAESRAAGARVVELTFATEAQAARLAETEPAAAALDLLSKSKGTFSLRDAAQLLNAKPIAFNAWLGTEGWIRKSGGDWMANQRAIDGGNMVAISLKPKSSPFAPAVKQPKITAKGLVRLAQILPTHLLNPAAAKARTEAAPVPTQHRRALAA